MTDRRGSYDFIYVHTDVPEGMTIREWCARRSVEESPRTRRVVRRQARALMARPLRAGLILVRRAEVRHSSGAHGSMSR